MEESGFNEKYINSLGVKNEIMLEKECLFLYLLWTIIITSIVIILWTYSLSATLCVHVCICNNIMVCCVHVLEMWRWNRINRQCLKDFPILASLTRANSVVILAILDQFFCSLSSCFCWLYIAYQMLLLFWQLFWQHANFIYCIYDIARKKICKLLKIPCRRRQRLYISVGIY